MINVRRSLCSIAAVTLCAGASHGQIQFRGSTLESTHLFDARALDPADMSVACSLVDTILKQIDIDAGVTRLLGTDRCLVGPETARIYAEHRAEINERFTTSGTAPGWTFQAFVSSSVEFPNTLFEPDPGSNVRTVYDASSELVITGWVVADLGVEAIAVGPGGIRLPDRSLMMLEGPGVRAEYRTDARVETVNEGFGRVLLVPGVYRITSSGEHANTRGSVNRVVATRAVLNMNLRLTDIASGPPPVCDGSGPCVDVDQNGSFDLDDLFSWLAAPIDVDGDGSVDPDPYGLDAMHLIGVLGLTDGLDDDCDGDTVPDRYQIAVDPSLDLDGNDLLDACGCIDRSDVTTTNTNPGEPGYGSPDGTVDGSDLSYFVEAWIGRAVSIADVTTTNTNPGEAGYGVPDGGVDGADLSYFVERWLTGCP